jgi:hypothetical protein
MKHILKKILIDVLGLVQAFPTGLTERKQLDDLIKKLHPVSADKELVRFGPKGDGGYLIPNDLVGIEACFSPGVEFISGFEKDCADAGMMVFMADKSVDKPEILNEKFHFTKKYVGVTSSDDFMTLDDWVNISLPCSQSDLLLQIDIEGYEYETFLGMSDNLLKRFRIIVAEFHSLDQLWSRPFFMLASHVFEKILQSHVCVHMHPNNCIRLLRSHGLDIPPVCEFTFLRKDRLDSISRCTLFPHPLDCDNTRNPHMALPTCWYES